MGGAAWAAEGAGADGGAGAAAVHPPPREPVAPPPLSAPPPAGWGGVGWGGAASFGPAAAHGLDPSLSRVGGWGGAFLLRMALCSCSCREGWAGGAGRGLLVADGFMFMLLSRGVGGWGLLVADGAEQVAEGGVVVLAALHQRPDEARVHAAVPPPWFGL